MLQQSLEAEVAEGIGERYAERTDGTIDWVCRACGSRNRGSSGVTATIAAL